VGIFLVSFFKEFKEGRAWREYGFYRVDGDPPWA
jgi:hypothetical protein